MNTKPRETVRQRVEKALAQDGELESRLQHAVEAIADEFQARTCTLHQADADGGLLTLRACIGLPEKLIPMTRQIPFGKGMAGICAERREPVTVCNLQTDTSGVARPAAKETRVAGALVVPLLREGAVLGTLGIGKAEDHEYTDEETRLLADCGKAFADLFYQQ